MLVERLNAGTLGQTLGVLHAEEKMLQTLPHSARMLCETSQPSRFTEKTVFVRWPTFEYRVDGLRRPWTPLPARRFWQ